MGLVGVVLLAGCSDAEGDTADVDTEATDDTDASTDTEAVESCEHPEADELPTPVRVMIRNATSAPIYLYQPGSNYVSPPPPFQVETPSLAANITTRLTGCGTTCSSSGECDDVEYGAQVSRVLPGEAWGPADYYARGYREWTPSPTCAEESEAQACMVPTQLGEGEYLFSVEAFPDCSTSDGSECDCENGGQPGCSQGNHSVQGTPLTAQLSVSLPATTEVELVVGGT